MPSNNNMTKFYSARKELANIITSAANGRGSVIIITITKIKTNKMRVHIVYDEEIVSGYIKVKRKYTPSFSFF